MLNVERGDLAGVLALLPALQRPTISALSDERWVAVNTIIEERTVRDLIPRLKAARAHGIVEYPLDKIVLWEAPRSSGRGHTRRSDGDASAHVRAVGGAPAQVINVGQVGRVGRSCLSLM